MGSMLKRTHLRIFVNLISLIGVISIYTALSNIAVIDKTSMAITLAIVSFLFFIFAHSVVTLPSGSSFRPAMAFILFSLLTFDYKIVILVAIPGTFVSVWGKKKFLSKFFLMIGHLSIGIYAAGFVYHQMLSNFTVTYYAYVAVGVSLALHFLVNRLVAAVIVAFRKQRSLLGQLSLFIDDLNWGYSSTYLIGILMFLLYRTYQLPGILLGTILLRAVNQSFTYYPKLKIMEEKVYLDVLTKAESRLSWEEFSKQMKQSGTGNSGIVYMMDLDYFKSINDSYGHDFGDRVLQEFVSHIRKEINRKYRLFRYGGDEFVLFVHSFEKDYRNDCEEINQMIYRQNEIWKKKGLAVSISFGHAFLSEKDPFENIVCRADQLMYKNKFSRNIVGRN